MQTTLPVRQFAATNRPSPAWKDEALVEECLRGNQEAWSAVVDKYKNLVYSAAVKYRMSPQDAEDIFQEVWVELCEELANLRNPGALGGWLISVALHKCFHWKRRRDRYPEQQPDPLAPDPPARDPLFPQLKEQAERAQILRDSIERLPERCRRMVRFLFYEIPPVPYADVARRFGVAEGSIGFIRGRCLVKLRKILEQEGF